VEQPQTILAQIIRPDPEPFELTLDLVRSRITALWLFQIQILTVPGAMAIVTGLRPPVLARPAHFAPRFQPRQVKLRNASTRFCALSSHEETLGDAPALGRGEIGQVSARIVLDVIVGSGHRWRGRRWWRCSV
jgi:hypothetical protein